MNLEISLPIIHVFIGLVLITASAFVYLFDRRSITNKLIAILLVLLGLTSIGVGLELNALTPSQALPWVALEVFSVYALSTATFVIALMLLLPEIGHRPIVRLLGVALIVVPLILLGIDLINESIPMVGFHFLINIDQYSATFTPGYQNIEIAADGIVQVGLFWLRNITYGILIFFPLLYVYWRDRNTNPFNGNNALILLIATLITAAINIFMIDLLPVTVASLLSSLIFGVAFTILSVRTSQAAASEGRSYDFFQNVPMFNKLLLMVVGILLPSLIFLGFSIYSFLQNTLIQSSNEYLRNFASSEAAITANKIDNLLQDIRFAVDQTDIQDLISEANLDYNFMTPGAIDLFLTYKEENQSFDDVPVIQVSDSAALSALVFGDNQINSISLIDSNGAMVTTTRSVRHYDHRGQPWWNQVKEELMPFVGIPSFDEELNIFSLQVVIPIFNPADDFIGAIEISYLVDDLLSSFEQSVGTDLTLGMSLLNQSVIVSKDGELITHEIVLGTGSSASATESWSTGKIDDQYVIFATQSVVLETPANELDWEISAYQSLDTALEPLYTSRNGLVVITFAIIAIAVIAVLFLARGISVPMQQLTEAAESLLGGNLNVNIPVGGDDEIGTLAATLNLMSAELNRVVNNLESTVDLRTKDLQRRTLQMQTSAQVARQAAEIRDLQSLLNQSVNLISERFNFYHTGIFLLDTAGRYAVLQAASSPGGQRMLARGHRLQVGKVGVVGYTAGSGQPRISQDVGADVVYYDNPDMPQTRSELALPLIVRENVIGVLDVQSSEATAFSQDDIDVLQILADQIALAIDNVRLLQSSQRALEELQRLYGQQAGQAWRQKLSGQPIAYQFTPTGLEEGDQKSTLSFQNRPGNKLQKDIKFRGQVIGNLNLMREVDDPGWSEEEQSLVDEILEQTALALENARLVDQIRLRSEQITLLQEISAISAEVLNEEKLLPLISEKLLSSLAVSHCGVVLLSDSTAMLVAQAGHVDGRPDLGTTINIDQEPLTQRLIRNKEVEVFNLEAGEERTANFSKTFTIPGTKTLIFLPIIVRERTAGYFYLENTGADREIDAEEYNLFNQLSAQISTALENIRLFDETSNRAERERQVAEITAKIRASNDPSHILQTAVIELKKALNVKPKKKQDDIQTPNPAPAEN